MSRRHKGHVPEPDFTHDDEGAIPCARGNRCSEADHLGIPKHGPRSLCETDTRYLRTDIADLPERYVELHGLLGRAGQGDDERVSGGSNEAPIPLAADVDALMREVVRIACDWEKAVRARGRLTAHPAGLRRRDGVRLATACETLTGHLDVMLSLGPHWMYREATRQRIKEIIGEDETVSSRFIIDRSGQAWERRQMTGTDAALEVFALTGKVRGALGLSLPVRKITEVRCDNCHEKMLIQRGARSGDWEPRVTCRSCPNVYAGARFDLLMGRVYQAQLAMQEAAQQAKAAG